MTAHPPSPVMAAVGLVVTAADGLRQLPRVLGSAGQEAARRYDELALRGQDVLAGHPLFGGAGPGLVTEGGPVPVGDPAELPEPWTAVERTGDRPGVAPEPGTGAGPAVGSQPVREPWVAAEPAGGAAAEPLGGPEAEPLGGPEAEPLGGPEAEPLGGPEAEVALEPPIGRTKPVVLPDDVLEQVAQMTPGAELAHGDLPLADFDHQTVPQLRGRLRTLDLAELVQLRDYEQAHAARLPVLTLLDNRIAKMLADTEQ